MTFRRLLAMFVALTVLIAPSLSHAAMPTHASASPAMAMMQPGHCDGAPAKSEKAPAKPCCVAMCMAVALAPMAAMENAQQPRAIAYFPVTLSSTGCVAEIATPPPKLS